MYACATYIRAEILEVTSMSEIPMFQSTFKKPSLHKIENFSSKHGPVYHINSV